MSVTLNTTFGPIRIKLFHRETPLTCRNFLELCKAGYYDGCIFHKVIPDFMCQTGDPLGTGLGGDSIYGKTFEDEITAKIGHSTQGMVSMANTGRNTNSSQFFITFKECPRLDGLHTVFGQVVDDTSLEVLQQFKIVRTRNKRPVKPVKIFSIEVTEDPWEGQPLPPNAKIPERPLVDTEDPCVVQ